jgi:hypothetical protein
MTTPSLNAAIGKALGVTPAREWRVKAPHVSWWHTQGESHAQSLAKLINSEAVEVECWPPYDSCRDAAAEMGEMLEKKNLSEDYIVALWDVIGLERRSVFWTRENFDALWRMIHASPAQRARAARVLGVEVNDAGLYPASPQIDP